MDESERAERRKAQKAAADAVAQSKRTSKITIGAKINLILGVADFLSSDFAGRRVVDANNADSAFAEARFGAVNQKSVAEDDEKLEERLRNELNDMELAKQLSLQSTATSSTSMADTAARQVSNVERADASSQFDDTKWAQLTATPMRPSDNISMRPLLSTVVSSGKKKKGKKPNKAAKESPAASPVSAASAPSRRVQHAFDVTLNDDSVQ